MTQEDKPKRHVTRPSNWWFVDSQGRNIGYMWPEDALAILDSVWGRRKGIGGFSRYAGYGRSTIERYCNGKTAIPKDVALMILMVQQIAINSNKPGLTPWRRLPSADADWLSDQPTKISLDAMPHG